MLIQLMSSEIPKYWPAIEASIKKTITKEVIDTQEKSNGILRALLLSRLSCWLFRDEDKIEAILLTTIMVDEFLQKRNLLLYSVFTKNNDAHKWILTMETLTKYAKDRKCEKIIFYTKREKIISLAKHLGFVGVFTMCECEI